MDNSYTANELGDPPRNIKNNNMKNWIYLILSAVTALCLWIVDPAAVETHTAIPADTFVIVKWIASAVLVVIGSVQMKAIADRNPYHNE